MAQITYRKPTIEDIEYVASHMREADIREVKAYGYSPKMGLKLSVDFSDEAYTGIIDGEVSIIFGYTAPNFTDGEVWALGTDKCFTIPRDMLIEGKKHIQKFLERAENLTNYIGADNQHSITWLKHLGFTISEPEPRGLNGEMFRKIEIKRKGK
jgi:hypothetical protein